jgi:hypothetical protein
MTAKIGILVCISLIASAYADDATPAAAPAPVNWGIKLTPKGTFNVGSQSKQEVGGAFNSSYFINPSHDPAFGSQRLSLDFNADNTLIEKPGSSVRTHEYDGQFNYLYYLKKNIYIVGLAEGYHNSSLNLYLQQSYGAGLGGKKELFGERASLELTADVRGIGEHFIGTSKAVTFAGARLGGEYVLKLNGSATPPELSIAARWIPALSQDKAWQARGRAVLSVPVINGFSLTISVTDDYLENTSRKNYSSSSVGITYAISGH